MAVYRAQITFPYDSALPRDGITVTPHYSGTDPQGLANALKASLLANAQITATGVFTIKVYDALAVPPSYPLATASAGTGFKTSTIPRELALCFSYYAVRNAARYRGRIYVPMPIIAGALNVRPTSTQMSQAADFGKALASGLPGGTAFVVYSRKERVARTATNYWVDDEWDVIRSRGLRSVTRNTGTLPQFVPAPVYSERFLNKWSTSAVNVSYIVPAGHRAVIKNILGLNTTSPTAAVSIYVTVAGVTVWFASLPGTYSFQSAQVMIVAYAGEEVKLTLSGSNQSASVSGYLLTDTVTPLGERPTQLPAPDGDQAEWIESIPA